MDTASAVGAWRLRRAARALGGFGMAATAMVVIALGLYALAVRPLASQVQSLRDQAAGQEAHAGNQQRDTGTVRPVSPLMDFYDQLPDAAQAPEIVRRLHAHAQDAGLMLERGEYRPLPDASAKLVRYQIVLPVKGSYPQVRQFLAAAMHDMPELALDGIGFQRDKGTSGRLEVQLQFTAFLKLAS